MIIWGFDARVPDLMDSEELNFIFFHFSFLPEALHWTQSNLSQTVQFLTQT